MKYTNSMADGLKPSETLAIKARATELKAQGKNIIDLSAGEPDLDTPQFIKDAAVAALKAGRTKYTNAAGIIELRQALAAKFKRENSLDYKPSQIVVTNGGKQALHEFFQVCLSPGDEVLIPSPYWVSYPAMVEIAGGKSVVLKTRAENGYRVTPEELSRAIGPKTRCLVMNSPSNPAGSGYTEAEQAALGQVLQKSNVLVVSDEVYEKITFGGFKFASFAAACPALYDRTITVGALSKTYAMTGWRVGYAAGPQPIIDAIVKFQGQTTSNINSIAQYAALAAIEGPQDFIGELISRYERRLEMALDLVKECPGLDVPVKPIGAFYLFIRFSGMREELQRGGLPGSAQLVNYILENAGVAAVPGEAFGDDDSFRISLAAADAEVKEGIQRIGACLAKFR